MAPGSLLCSLTQLLAAQGVKPNLHAKDQTSPSQLNSNGKFRVIQRASSEAAEPFGALTKAQHKKYMWESVCVNALPPRHDYVLEHSHTHTHYKFSFLLFTTSNGSPDMRVRRRCGRTHTHTLTHIYLWSWIKRSPLQRKLGALLCHAEGPRRDRKWRRLTSTFSAASVGGGVADAQILREMRGRGDKRRKGN